MPDRLKERVISFIEWSVDSHRGKIASQSRQFVIEAERISKSYRRERKFMV